LVGFFAYVERWFSPSRWRSAWVRITAVALFSTASGLRVIMPTTRALPVEPFAPNWEKIAADGRLEVRDEEGDE
jgi:hypothetical protein